MLSPLILAIDPTIIEASYIREEVIVIEVVVAAV